MEAEWMSKLPSTNVASWLSVLNKSVEIAGSS
jgi:hypothetical protein